MQHSDQGPHSKKRNSSIPMFCNASHVLPTNSIMLSHGLCEEMPEAEFIIVATAGHEIEAIQLSAPRGWWLSIHAAPVGKHREPRGVAIIGSPSLTDPLTYDLTVMLVSELVGGIRCGTYELFRRTQTEFELYVREWERLAFDRADPEREEQDSL